MRSSNSSTPRKAPQHQNRSRAARHHHRVQPAHRNDRILRMWFARRWDSYPFKQSGPAAASSSSRCGSKRSSNGRCRRTYGGRCTVFHAGWQTPHYVARCYVFGTSPHAAPGTCRRDPRTKSRRSRPIRRTASAPRLRWRRSSRAMAWCSRTQGVTWPSHSGSKGVTFTIMPQF